MDILAVIIVVTILILSVMLIWYYRRTDDYKRHKYKNRYKTSTGGFDTAAVDTMRMINEIQDPIAEDHFYAGAILEQNLLQGDLVRANPRILNNIVHRYENTLMDIFDRTEAARHRFGNRRRVDNPVYMVDHMQQFRDNINAQIGRQLADDALFAFNAIIDNTTPVIRQANAEERKERAITNANNRDEAVDNYFRETINYTSQSQNVHDNKVNKDLKETYERLRKTRPEDKSATLSMNEARQFITDEYALDENNKGKVDDALEVLNRISQGNYISTFGDSEDNIFATVWERSNHPGNAETATLMKEAVIDSLADCKENGHVVCINGRCGRMLASPVLLDYDDEVGKAKTYEAYKNEIFELTNKTMKDIAKEYKNSDIELKRAVGRSFEDPSVDTDPAIEQVYRDDVKKELETILDGYKEKLTDKELDSIRKDCHAAVDI